MNASETAQILTPIRQYYDRSTELYVRHLGTTIQSGVLKSGAAAYGPEQFRAHNLFLAERAGIRPGHRVLDAGCGVCGPSVDIAGGISGVQIDAMTLSPVQSDVARGRIKRAGLEERVRVHVGDFHRLPFADGTFDVAFFFESAGYSHDPVALFGEILRVVRPDGIVYVKDVFAREAPLSAPELAELDEFNRVYVYRTATMRATARAMEAAGFRGAACTDLSPWVDPEPFHLAMVDWAREQPGLNPFGEMHFRPFKCLPIVFGDVRACK